MQAKLLKNDDSIQFWLILDFSRYIHYFVNVLKTYIDKVYFPLVSWQVVTQPFFLDTNKVKVNAATYTKHLCNQLFPNLMSFISKRNSFSPRTEPVLTQRSLHKATWNISLEKGESWTATSRHYPLKIATF